MSGPDRDDWERFDYPEGLTVWQRECQAGCDQGMLFAPARFCPACGGSGYETTEEDPHGRA